MPGLWAHVQENASFKAAHERVYDLFRMLTLQKGF